MNRRQFLQGCGLFAAGTITGALLPTSLDTLTAGGGPSAEGRLRELGLTLPEPGTPSNPFVPTVRAGNLLFTSGMGPKQEDGTYLKGKVGSEMTLEQGKDAARLTGINVLGAVRAHLGSLDKVVRVVKVLGMVNCTTDFTQQPAVINGFSELLVEVFGEVAGKGGRSAVGMGSLPGNIPVEIEAVFQVRD